MSRLRNVSLVWLHHLLWGSTRCSSKLTSSFRTCLRRIDLRACKDFLKLTRGVRQKTTKLIKLLARRLFSTSLWGLLDASITYCTNTCSLFSLCLYRINLLIKSLAFRFDLEPDTSELAPARSPHSPLENIASICLSDMPESTAS